MRKEKFKIRAFIVLSVFWTFIVEAVSGIVLYTVPPGRIADWSLWTFFGLTKSEWEAIHTVFGYLFLLFVSIHLYKNWKSITHYIIRKIKSISKVRKELFISASIVIIVLIGTIMSVPPFHYVMDFGSTIKKAWPENKNKPFLVRAEKLSFSRFVDELGISPEEAIKVLNKNGIYINNKSDSIINIAEDNKTSPAALYELIKNLPSSKNNLKDDFLLKRE